MKPKKLNFAEIKNVLSRNEMKQIMAGSDANVCHSCTVNSHTYQCVYNDAKKQCWCDADNTGCGSGS